MSSGSLYDLAASTLTALGDRTVATAESLTGGLISAALTEVPGASRVFRGSIVCYASEVKISTLGVDSELIASGGAIQEAVALQMAQGACSLLGSDFGLAVTGVAGPAPQDGQQPGTVCIAVVEASDSGEVVSSHTETLTINLDGVAPAAQRAYIRNYTVEYGLDLLKSMALGQVPE